jgi:hypothetical protein
MNAVARSAHAHGWDLNNPSRPSRVEWAFPDGMAPRGTGDVDLAPPPSYAVRSRLISRLRSLLNLRTEGLPGGYLPPASATILAAVDFINRLPEDRVADRVGLANDGEISIFWERKDYFIDIGFEDGLLTSFYAKLPEGELFGDDPMPVHEWDQLIRKIPAVIA